ncbi:MAG: hypothetical protein ABJF11_01130 [Reichenbachiella sp.]|uniref:hypothetical protein n=1 Tax=Reichenbachiella sp. TaxID=2184521 RepID=UPI0032640A26
MLTKFIAFACVMVIGITNSQERQVHESLLIKHNFKVIDNGFFVFCESSENDGISETTFSYSINLKKKNFNVVLLESKSLTTISDSYLVEFDNSINWNQKRTGSYQERYFLVFDSAFIKWNNSEKLRFFLNESKKK